jgi:predicted RNA polymerase sigma factor
MLNRAIAMGNAVGPAAQGEFHLLAGRPAEAAKNFEKATKLARNRSETDFFERKLRACHSTNYS